MRALLDVNVLVALFDAEHVFHEKAHAWLKAEAGEGIASCSITENGLVRILSHPNYSQNHPLTPAWVVEGMQAFFSHQDHAFWPDTVSLRDPNRFDPSQILGSRQVTDVYLLGLSLANQGRLVTLDHGISRSAVPLAAEAHLCLI